MTEPKFGPGDIVRLKESSHTEPVIITSVHTSPDVFTGEKVYGYSGESRRDINDPETRTHQVQVYENQIELISKAKASPESSPDSPASEKPKDSVFREDDSPTQQAIDELMSSEDSEDEDPETDIGELFDEMLASAEDLNASIKGIKDAITEGVGILKTLFPASEKPEPKK